MANYVSTHTGEQIDEAVDKALPLVSTAEQIDKTVNKAAFVSNKNILDNGTFIVNQRGNTSYTAAGYTVDRWKTTGGTVTVGTDGIKWQNATASSTLYFSQYFESLEGGMYTLSIKLKNGNIYAVSGEIPATLPTSGTTYYISIDPSDSAFRRLNLAYNATTKLWFVQLSLLAGTSVDIKAIKLEQGEVTTIDNEKNTNFTEELLKCQRFYRKFSSYYKYFAGVVYDSTHVYFSALINNMRADPMVTLPGTWRIRHGSTSATPSAIEGAVSGNVLQVTATISGGTAGQGAFLYFNNPCVIELSADL